MNSYRVYFINGQDVLFRAYNAKDAKKHAQFYANHHLIRGERTIVRIKKVGKKWITN